MNGRLIIIWLFAVILFFGLGMFGYINRDLFKEEEPQEYVPKVEEEHVKNCNLILEQGQSIYQFFINEDKITKYSVTYEATQEDIIAYEAATNINNELYANPIDGVTVVFNGTLSDFKMILVVDLENVNVEKSVNIMDQLRKLNIQILNIDNYEEFQTRIDELNGSYSCE